MAQKEAFGENIELEIIGSLKDAQVFVRRQINKDTGICNSCTSIIFQLDDPFILSSLSPIRIDSHYEVQGHVQSVYKEKAPVHRPGVSVNLKLFKG